MPSNKKKRHSRPNAPRIGAPRKKRIDRASFEGTLPFIDNFSCTVKQVIHVGELAIVLLVLYDGSDRILKLFSPNRPSGSRNAYEFEYRAYTAMYPHLPASVPRCFGFIGLKKPLKYIHPAPGLVLPPCLATFGPTRGLVLEYLPPSEYRYITPDDVEALQDKLLPALEQALEAVHQCGVLHRDIAPRNLLISNDGTSTKILDFDNSISTLDWEIPEPIFEEEKELIRYIGIGDLSAWRLL